MSVDTILGLVFLMVLCLGPFVAWVYLTTNDKSYKRWVQSERGWDCVECPDELEVD